jgi:hypothetical protein
MSKSSNACPTFFRCLLAEAKSSRAGYFAAGHELARHCETLVTGDVDDDVIEDLHHRRDAADPAEAVWEWMRAALPRCMRLVPLRRKVTFLRGVESAIEEGLL